MCNSFIKFSSFCNIHRLEARQILPQNIKQVFKFCKSSQNLKHICPDYMKFDQQSEFKDIYAKQIIAYKIYPFKYLPAVNWITEITDIQEPNYFVDEQRFGPYKMWHHEHHFNNIDENNTMMIDIVHYKLHFGILGTVVNNLIVQKQLLHIFQFRHQQLDKYFKNK